MLTGLFGLSKNIQPKPLSSVDVEKDRSFKNIPILGIPASLAFGFVVHPRFVRIISDFSKVWSSLHDLCRWSLRMRNEIWNSIDDV